MNQQITTGSPIESDSKLLLESKYSSLIREAKEGVGRRKSAHTSRLLFLEGKQLIKEALANSKSVSMLRIFCADEFLQKNDNEMFVQNTLSKFRWSKLNKQILNKWSSMETSQGIFGIQRKCGFLFLFQMYLKMKTKSKTKKKRYCQI